MNNFKKNDTMSWKLICVNCVLVLLIHCLNLSETLNITVTTNDGDICGYVLNLNGSNVVGSKITSVNMFLGIPYAESPEGNLRFSRPVPKSPWLPKILNAFSFSSSCPQRPSFIKNIPSSYDDFSEDCLYLNIYAPHNAADPAAIYPVLFWIHGGAYQYGSGAEYDGRILAQEGIIVVTINYRLGALGFLSTDDDVAPGNYGLLDQLMALKWVKENIAAFHGNPNKITISGQSAGGGSTSLHMFSQKAKGLFNSVISQSGCALCPWAIYRPPYRLTTSSITLAQMMDCPTTDSVAMVSCLRNVNAIKLANSSVSGPPMIATFAPRVDGYYINDLPEKLLEHGDYLHGVTVLTGFVPDEVAEGFDGELDIDQGLTKQHLEKLFYSKSQLYRANADNMLRAMECAYPPSDTNVFLNRQHLIDMYSDHVYVAPHIKLSEKLSAAGENVWLYTFIYRSPNSLKKQWIGVPHSEELYYMYGAPFLDQSPCPDVRNVTCPATWGKYQQWSSDDEQVSKNVMKLWADFVKLDHGSKQFITTKNLSQFSPGENLIQINAVVTSQHLVKSPGVRFWDSFNYLNLTATIPDICATDSSILVG